MKNPKPAVNVPRLMLTKHCHCGFKATVTSQAGNTIDEKGHLGISAPIGPQSLATN